MEAPDQPSTICKEQRNQEEAEDKRRKGAQYPLEIPVQHRVNRLEVLEDKRFLEDHLVEGGVEVNVKRPSMEDAKTKASADKLEVFVAASVSRT
jgi:hypothetical protein